MEELIKRLERVIATGPTAEDGMHPISAEAVLEVVKELSEPSTNCSEIPNNSDAISRQAAIDAIKGEIEINGYSHVVDVLKQLPSAQPEIVLCKDCKYWNDEFAKDKSICWLPCMSMTTHRKWYCGSAERRADEA